MANQKSDQRNEDKGKQNSPATPPAPDAPVTENPESLRLIRAYYQTSPTDEGRNTQLVNLVYALGDHLSGTDKYKHDRRLAVIRMALAATLDGLEPWVNEPETRNDSRRRQQSRSEPFSPPSNKDIQSIVNKATTQVSLHHLREHPPLSDEASPVQSLQWLRGLSKAYYGNMVQHDPDNSFEAARAWHAILDKLPSLVEWKLLNEGFADAASHDPKQLLRNLHTLFQKRDALKSGLGELQQNLVCHA